MIWLLALATIMAEGETPFKFSERGFSTAAACKAFLATRAGEARGEDFDAVEGPYQIAADDVRIHMVRAEGNGHRIDEQRCLGSALSGRSWRHSLEDEERDEDAFTVESVARSAAWLKKGSSQQQ